MTRRRGILLAVLATLLASLLIPGSAGAQDRSWLALGDSYSSGEGLTGTSQDPELNGVDGQGRNCERAIGDDSTAWAQDAFERERDSLGLGAIDFVACTGAITDQVGSQLAEARSLGGRRTWDLASFSFGGNNIGFADILFGCLDIGSKWDLFDLTPGCDVSKDQLHNRIDMLAGTQPIDSGEYEGSTNLPALFDLVGKRINPGGDVFVVGYPNLIEEVGRWDSWRRRLIGSCEGIKDYDVPLLRDATSYLNSQTALAVKAADQRFKSKAVRFHFIDISKDPYEYSSDPGARHGLCSDHPWLNGQTLGLAGPGAVAIHRSFHPTQEGHTNTGRVIAAFMEDHGIDFDVTVPVVLGSPEYLPRNGSGFGEEEPGQVFNGGAPSGLLQDIQWTNWGAPTTTGVAKKPIYKAGGGYYGELSKVTLEATNIGTCPGESELAYRTLLFRTQTWPGSPLGPTQKWNGTQDLCDYGNIDPAYDYPTTPPDFCGYTDSLDELGDPGTAEDITAVGIGCDVASSAAKASANLGDYDCQVSGCETTIEGLACTLAAIDPKVDGSATSGVPVQRVICKNGAGHATWFAIPFPPG